jgi:hypothetical protein
MSNAIPKGGRGPRYAANLSSSWRGVEAPPYKPVRPGKRRMKEGS